jgi:hypothetical protein
MAKQTLLQRLQNKHKSLQNTFIERHWQRDGSDIKDFLVPDRGRFLRSTKNDLETNRSDKDDRSYVIDDTAERALEYLVNGFMSMLTPPTTPWLKLKTSNPQFKDIKRVNVWLDDVSDLILKTYSQSDVYGALRNTFTEFCSFGTGAQMIKEDAINQIIPKGFTFGEYFMDVNGEGKPDTFMYKFYLTAQQIKDMFGEENMRKQLKRELGANPESRSKLHMVYHLIEPNDGRRGVSNPQGFPFNSFYWEDEANKDDGILSISGFPEFPVQLPKWNTISNDTYGKESPGRRQLGNIKMLQSITEDIVIITKRIGDPPLVSNSDFNSINTIPGGITTTTDALGNNASVVPLLPNDRPDLKAIAFLADRTIQQIEKGFFNQLFLAVTGAENDRMTATEVVARNEEKFAMLGPVLDRVFNELLEPMTERTLKIFERQGFFDEDGPLPMPPELDGELLEIEFISILAQAQKAVGLNNIDRFLERMSVLAQLDPSALDGIDVDAIRSQYGQNVPAVILRDLEEVIEIREQRQLQQEAAAQMAAMESAAETTKNMSQAHLGQNSVLDELAAEEA